MERSWNYLLHAQTHKWTEDNQMTTQPLVNPEQTRVEWALLKKVVKALQPHYPRGSMWKLWALLTNYHLKDFPNLTILAQLATTLPVHTADCERGFSAHNLILTGTGCHQNIKSRFSRSSLDPKDQSSLLKRHSPNGKRSSRESCTV